MSTLNAVLRGLFDGLLYPLRDLPAVVGVIAASLVTAVGMLLVFRTVSDQKGIAAVKRRIHACLFEIRLFNDDLRAILRAQFEILRHNLTYFRLSLAPMLWMIVPILLLIAQLQFHYGYRGLVPGESAVLTVALAENSGNGAAGDGGARPSLRLAAPPGLRVETPAVWAPSVNEVSWRVGAERPGEYELELELDGEVYTKSVRVSDEIVRRSPIRLPAGFVNQLLYPAEEPLPKDGPIESISLTYPEGDVDIFGWRLHWMIVFFVASVVFAFALKSLFGVTL
jgi:uncharacterized membrane protein (DUF106 family)